MGNLYPQAFLIISLILFALPASGHEPAFGLGPHTIYKGGIGLELEYEQSKKEGDGKKIFARNLHLEMIYGITEDLSFTLALPQINKSKSSYTSKVSSSGLGDITLRGKYRFYRKDSFGATRQIALISGIKTPTGSRSGKLALGSGSFDFLTGLAYGYESRLWYYFGDIRAKLNTAYMNDREGHTLFYDLAFGVRPFRTEYLSPDLVTLIELNGELEGKEKEDGLADNNSGGHILSVSPGALLSYRNIMLKLAVKLPVLQNLNGNQPEEKYEFVTGIEFHL